MTDIYAFPPAGIVSWRLAEDRRVLRSRYALSGARAVSGLGSPRRMVDLTVSALSRDRAGAGYLAQLWRYIDGGVGLVRLTLPPQNWHLDWMRLQAQAGNAPLFWTTGGGDLDWTTGAGALQWFVNTVRLATVTTLAGYPFALQVTGLPPGIIVARPGDILRIYDPDDGADLGVAMVLDLTRANASGVAVVPVDADLPAGVAAFGDERSAVFEVTAYTPGAQGLGQNWTLALSLTEVLTSEIDTPVEVNPWRG
jgi:hypothetical protein